MSRLCIGASFQIYRSVSGNVYLAILPEQERDEFLQLIKADTEGVTSKDLEVFNGESESVRKDEFG
jgi:DNA-binding IclR family transcriptional regulator